jgi:hypothetical protein
MSTFAEHLATLLAVAKGPAALREEARRRSNTMRRMRAAKLQPG